jgi:hypothetical protein
MRIGTPTAVLRECRQATTELRRPVACPRLVPNAPVVHFPGVNGLVNAASIRDFYALAFNTGGEDPRSPASIHWVTGVGTLSAVKKWALSTSRDEVKKPIVYLGTRRVAGVSVAIYRFPPFPAGGEYGGHTFAVVKRGSLEYFASVHGYMHLDASMAMAVALALYR